MGLKLCLQLAPDIVSLAFVFLKCRVGMFQIKIGFRQGSGSTIFTGGYGIYWDISGNKLIIDITSLLVPVITPTLVANLELS